MLNNYLKALIVKEELQNPDVLQALRKSNKFEEGSEEEATLIRFFKILFGYKESEGYRLNTENDCLPRVEVLFSEEDYNLVKEVWHTRGDTRKYIGDIELEVRGYASKKETGELVTLIDRFNKETNVEKKDKLLAEIDNLKARLKRLPGAKRGNVEVDEWGLECITPENVNLEASLSLGPRYAYLNQAISGTPDGKFVRRGQVITVMGKSGTGKSTTLYNFAASCIEEGYRCCFVSTEQTRYEATEGIYRCLLKVSKREWTQNATVEWVRNQFLAKSGAQLNVFGEPVKEGNWILPAVICLGQSSTMEEYEDTIQNIQEQKGKFDVVFLDYPAKMRIKPINQFTKFGDYGEEKRVWEEIAEISSRNKWLTVTAVQVNRGGLNEERLEVDKLGGSIQAYESSAYFFTSDRITDPVDGSSYTELTCKKDRNRGDKVGEATRLVYEKEHNLLKEIPTV